jgi:hypothetical protein
MGGAVGRVPADATAFGDRSGDFLLNVIASTFTADGFSEAVRWAQDLHAAIAPSLSGGSYVNFLPAEGEDRVRASYGERTFARLQNLKDEHDPSNLFRLNQNIPPSA